MCSSFFFSGTFCWGDTLNFDEVQLINFSYKIIDFYLLRNLYLSQSYEDILQCLFLLALDI